ncbi:cullin-5 isoform X1 [Betta splendens]|uniref:Cullin-5 n=2 Tax=Betta splendens TaxID=158456 RepID=A0A9W2Y7M9_BETSP|nr:cullin-5 isoform X1 [Betta splendens]
MAASNLLKNKGSLQFEDKWDLMRPIVLKLLRQEAVTKQQWFDLFSDVHAVCLWDDKGPAKIHQALKEDILDFIKQAQARVLSHQDDTALLKAYIVEWRKFFTQCDILPKPFCQLEITLMGKQGSNKKSNVEDSIVRKLMLDTWNESIFSNIKSRLQDSAMKLVHAERLGEAFDSQLVIGVRESYVNLCSNPEDKLQIYRDNFEKAYLDSTERFYRTQAPSYLQQNGVQNYMKYADAKLREEEKRALRYLETRRECNSVQALMECCVNALVTSFKETILAECPGMIKRNETEKLHLMFSLMDKVPSGIEPMLKDLEEHIINAGLADMVAAAETITSDSEKYVEQLLTLFNRFSKLVKEAFQDDPRFLTARDKAYKAVVNDATIFKLELPMKQKGVGMKTQPESKCPELLANYCDMLLRKTPLSKKLTSEEIELKLKEVLLVLKYVQNKDVFMRYHKAHLTRRLILDISADSEIEENMVEWLRVSHRRLYCRLGLMTQKGLYRKSCRRFVLLEVAALQDIKVVNITFEMSERGQLTVCWQEVGMPADYVNKLARMFQDIKVSEDLNQVFKEMHKHNKLALPADSVNIKILNAGAWSRSSEKVFVSLPTELEDLIPEVEDFYKRNHSGRKLHWHHLMSNGIITFKNEVGQYDLEVTTFQLAVLFAWNQRPRERISFENLKLATELPDAELRRTLWSLVAFPKLKRQVLSYEPPVSSPKDFTDSTLFYVNQEFSLIKNAKVQKRGKINLIGRLQLTTERMREEENEGIVQLRILRTQEAIIQIMKMRKRISNAQLQTELVEILKNMFLPQKKMIKEQIEWLIEHKYIKRDEADINTFIYMA